MRALYIDGFAGISGDMLIGALIDLGVEFDGLREQLATLGLSGYELSVERVKRSGIAASKFTVTVDEGRQPARKLADVIEIINRSSLSNQIKARAIQVFERLADAEAHVHASTRDRVHFHEVGAVDSIIDTVGAMIGFEMLGIEQFISSPLRLGHGTIKAAHGLLPIPAPATAELLRGVPVYAGELEGEFVTPTGAAIVTSFAERFGPMPQMTITRTGYGAGTRDPKGFPNALRVLLGEVNTTPYEAKRTETISVIETNIDDMNPQAYGFVLERAFAMGALDVFMIATQMKKSRPGILLTLLCEPAKAEALIEMLLRETTTLGVRYYETRRRALERMIEEVETGYGRVRVKVARDGARTLHFQPEYDDCVQLALASGNSVLEVQSAASAAYRERMKRNETNGEREEK